jgi:hypothetical protein
MLFFYGHKDNDSGTKIPFQSFSSTRPSAEAQGNEEELG